MLAERGQPPDIAPTLAARITGAIQRAGAPLPTMLIGTLPVVIAVTANRRNQLRDGSLPWRQLLPSLLPALQARLSVTEKRATFACTPALQRPPGSIAPGLAAAGDYIEGPYPATLEAAVRAGVAAIRRS